MSILTTPTPEAHILPHAKPITEFVPRPNGTLFNGTCTEAAAEECLGISQGRDPTLENVALLAEAMIARGIADLNGATNLDNITTELIAHGARVEAKVYGPDQQTWIEIFRAEAGERPVLVQFANANVLHDIYSDLRVEPGVMRHACALVGVTPNVCYWFMDPDHPQAQERLVGYTLAELIAAQPYGILVLEMEAQTMVLPTIYPVAQGWEDDGTTLIANHFPVVQGFRDWCLSHNFSLGMPLCREWSSNGETHQIFTYGVLGWNPHDGVFQCNVGNNFISHVWYDFPSEALIPLAPVVITPTPTPAPLDPNKVKLAQAQKWFGGENKMGVYCGIWTFRKTPQQMAPIAQNIKAWGFDYAYVKFEESGVQFFPNPISEYQQVFADAGVRIMPYIYDRPQYTQVDVDTGLKLIDAFGGVDLDVEEVFLGHATELQTLFHELRQQRPEAIIVADGYGDPVSAFGRGAFPFSSIKEATIYQPQWYESFMYGGLPGSMTVDQWLNSLNNNDAQVGQEFDRGGLGTSFPIRPCVDGVMSLEVAQAVGQWAARFGLGLTVWEYKNCTAPLVAALKAGLMKGLGQ